MKFMTLITLSLTIVSCHSNRAEAKKSNSFQNTILNEFSDRSCTSANATYALQSWNGNGWGSCNVIKCHEGFLLISNMCVLQSARR